MQSAEHNGRGDHEIALGLGIFARRRALDLIQLLQDSLGAGDIRAAGRRQLQPLGRTDQQRRVQIGLEFGHLAADRGQRQSQLAARLRQAAALDRGEQHRHGIETIQRGPSVEREVSSRS